VLQSAASASVLDEVARHEKSLMSQVEQANEEARRIIGAAHEKASEHIIEVQHQLERDLAEMRRNAYAAREAAERKVSEIRAKATPNLDAIKQLVVASILPGAAGKGQS